MPFLWLLNMPKLVDLVGVLCYFIHCEPLLPYHVIRDQVSALLKPVAQFIIQCLCAQLLIVLFSSMIFHLSESKPYKHYSFCLLFRKIQTWAGLLSFINFLANGVGHLVVLDNHRDVKLNRDSYSGKEFVTFLSGYTWSMWLLTENNSHTLHIESELHFKNFIMLRLIVYQNISGSTQGGSRLTQTWLQPIVLLIQSVNNFCPHPDCYGSTLCRPITRLDPTRHPNNTLPPYRNTLSSRCEFWKPNLDFLFWFQVDGKFRYSIQWAILSWPDWQPWSFW